ncbi:MAG: PIN domain-containing protein [Paludibacter sp.]
MKYLFLDTNIFLHFRSFEQIDWSKLIEVDDEYCIVIPEIVIKEIDKIKDTGRGKIQKRAKIFPQNLERFF